MEWRVAACAAVLVAVSGCGGGDSTSESATRGEGADLTVRLTHPREDAIRYRCSSRPRAGVAPCDPRRLAQLRAALRRHARRDRVCTEIYGGPQRAVVAGTLGGERVSATFTRVDGCAIADYDALMRALGRAGSDTRAPDTSGIAPPDAGTDAGHGADPASVTVPDRDLSPPSARIVLAAARGGRTLAEAAQPPDPAAPAPVELAEPRLRGTTLGADHNGGVARVRVSISERITCRAADGERFERLRTRYFPPPQIERIRSTPGARLPTTKTRSLLLAIGGPRCEVHGELWGEAINGSGLEAVTPHIRFVYVQRPG